MPMEIKIVLPVPGNDDTLSVTESTLSTQCDVASLNEDCSWFSVNGAHQTADEYETDEINGQTILVDNSIKPTGRLKNDDYNIQDWIGSGEEFQEKKYPVRNSPHVKQPERNDLKTPGDEKTGYQDDQSEWSCMAEQESAERRVKSAGLQHFLKQSKGNSLISSVRKDVHNPRHTTKIFGSVTKKPKKKADLSRTRTQSTNAPKQTKVQCATVTMMSMEVPVASIGLPMTSKGAPVKKPPSRPASSRPQNNNKADAPIQMSHDVPRIKIAITGTYDVEQEHQDIMIKALKSYQQHCRHITAIPNSTKTDINSNFTEQCDKLPRKDDDFENENDNRDQDKTESPCISQFHANPESINAKLRKIKILRDILGKTEEINSNFQVEEKARAIDRGDETNVDGVIPEREYHFVYDDDKPVQRKWQHDTKENLQRTHTIHPHSYRNKRTKGKGVDMSSRSMSAMSNHEQDKMFRLSQCQLIYGDEQEKKKKVRPMSSSYADRLSRLASGTSGVLVDSVGHVYGCSRPRPLSALPCKFSMYLKDDNSTHRHAATSMGELSHAENSENSTTSSQQDITNLHFQGSPDYFNLRQPSTTTPNTKETSVDHSTPPGCNNPDPQVSVLNLQLSPAAMNEPMPRAVAFNRRNRTTHSWSDAPSMSQSVPNASFLHKQFTTSPPPMKIRTRGTSPIRAGKPSVKQERPSSSYSYDGGFFLGAHSAGAEYFVIHPDWVSEALTINKIGGGGGAGSPVGGNVNTAKHDKQMSKLRLPQRRWSERRCMSAPPSKFRNPIAWEDPVSSLPRGNKKGKV